jgi:two-component system response regulator ChvI
MTRIKNEKNNNYNDKKRVLIVDDEPDLCTVLKMVLEDSGFEANSFEDPTLALKNFKAGLYDLVLLDIKMPEMDGFQLYQKIKEIDNKVKVCFLTASELYYEGVRKESFCKGDKVDKEVFLAKPIENEDLVNQINKIMSS